VADQIDQLRQTIQELITVLGKGGKPSPATKEEDDARKKSAAAFSQFGNAIKGMLTGFVGIGAALKGLQGTREGYQLSFSTQHLFYEIANALRAPIRFITNELEGLARVMHRVNTAGPGGAGVVGNAWKHYTDPYGLRKQIEADANKNFAGTSQAVRDRHPELSSLSDAKMYRNLHPGIAYIPDAVLERQAREGKLKDYRKAAPRPPGASGDQPLQPMFHSEFGDVAGLQQKMQALSTENPAQKRGLSLIETIAKAVIKMAYDESRANTMFPEDGGD
jgi:hypothetical protein